MCPYCNVEYTWMFPYPYVPVPMCGAYMDLLITKRAIRVCFASCGSPYHYRLPPPLPSANLPTVKPASQWTKACPPQPRIVGFTNRTTYRKSCVCMSFIFYPAACGPKGHGSGLPLPSRTAALSTSPYMTVSCPQPLWVILGQPFLLLPTPPD